MIFHCFDWHGKLVPDGIVTDSRRLGWKLDPIILEGQALLEGFHLKIAEETDEIANQAHTPEEKTHEMADVLLARKGIEDHGWLTPELDHAILDPLMLTSQMEGIRWEDVQAALAKKIARIGEYTTGYGIKSIKVPENGDPETRKLLTRFLADKQKYGYLGIEVIPLHEHHIPGH